MNQGNVSHYKFLINLIFSKKNFSNSVNQGMIGGMTGMNQMTNMNMN
jgi:hypothetical protein